MKNKTTLGIIRVKLLFNTPIYIKPEIYLKHIFTV